MLFTAKANGDFRRPEVGAPALLGDTDFQDCPLEPIELVDEIPFLITYGYVLAGRRESAESYARYCLQNCDWSPTRYKVKTAAEKQAALSKLLASPKWKGTLNADDREFLILQIQ